MKLETTDVFKTLSHYNPDLLTLTDDQVRAVQTVELETLDDVLSVCGPLGIRYHLTGGSALGAVRHNGFIPWDDDLDIDMARSDVKRFLKAFCARYGDKYWVHSPSSKGLFSIPCINIRRRGTVFQGCVDSSPEECGVSLDIAIMENTFNNPLLRFLHGFGSMTLGFLVSCRRFYANRTYLRHLAGNCENVRAVFEKKIRFGRLISFLPLSAWVRMYDRWNSICHDDNSVYVTVPTGRNHFFREMYRRDKFYESTNGTFEGRTVCLPYDTDAYLRHMYGDDYMTVPPKEKQEQHTLVQFKV